MLFSDTLTRVAFLLFILLVPVGFHHQFVDPGVSSGLKFTVAAITFAIFFPSLMTAFSVMYALEIGGRRRGGNGLVGWFFRIPWSDPSVAAQVLAMVAFLLGGISGLMNASYAMNMEIPQHGLRAGSFSSHDRLRGSPLLHGNCPLADTVPRAARAMVFAPRTVPGVFVFLRRDDFLTRAHGRRHRGNAAARRYGTRHLQPAGVEPGIMAGIGGSQMFTSAMIFFFIPVMTLVAGKKTEQCDVPFTATVHAPPTIGWQPRLDRLGYWVIASTILVIAVYGPFVLEHFPPRLTTAGLLYP